MGLVVVAVALLTGCNSAPKRDPAYAPVRPIAPPPAPVGNGAIYQAGYERAWFEDMRARRVGDMHENRACSTCRTQVPGQSGSDRCPR